MKINKYNEEVYHDPTPYEAFTSIEAERRAAQPPPSAAKTFRPIVFICSPYADDPLNNERRAIRYCRFAVRQGYIPIAPHIYFTRFLDDRNPKHHHRQRDTGMLQGRHRLQCADERRFPCACQRQQRDQLDRLCQSRGHSAELEISIRR